MVKKILAGMLAISLMAGMVACNGSSGNGGQANSGTPQSAADLKDDESQFLTITQVRPVKESVAVKQDLMAEKLKEKFNMEVDTTEVSISDYVTKMSLIFASGTDVPDIFNLREEWKLNDWVSAGYAKGFTIDEIKKYIPNYITAYGDDWDAVYKTIKSSDGKVYQFPGVQATKINMAWMFRTDTMDDLKLKTPTTTDELFDVLKTVKDKTGRIPYVAASSSGVLWAFSGFLQSFGMPELSIRQLSYVDPTTNTFVPYAFSENNYRQFLIYMNKLYDAGLIWKEFSTATNDQVKKFQSQGNGYVLWGYPEQIATYENMSKTTDATAKWGWSKDMISADPNKVYFKRNDLYNAGGTGFSPNMSEQKLARYLKYINWECTEEGQLFQTFGKEGLTYEMKDGKPQYTDNMVTPTKAKGDKLTEYGINGFVVQHPAKNEVYSPVLEDVEKAFMNRTNYYFFTAPPMPYTDQETSDRADIETSINDTRDEYAAKFIMGQLDPSNDSAWQDYINTLNKLGLEQLKKIRTDVYNRGQS